MTHPYRADFEAYLDAFDEGFIEWDQQERLRQNTEFTEDEERLLTACISIIERMRRQGLEVKEAEIQERLAEQRFEMRQDYEELHAEIEALKPYKDFYVDMRSAVNLMQHIEDKEK